MASYEDLEVFKRAYRLSLEIHRTSLSFPSAEQYALANQIRRASKSICANLAEGSAKWSASDAEFRRYLQMALGSAEEMKVWSRYCVDLGYIDSSLGESWESEYREIAKMLNGLAKSTRRSR